MLLESDCTLAMPAASFANALLVASLIPRVRVIDYKIDSF